MKLGIVAALISTAMMLAGCASVARGTTEAVVFESEPPNAYVHTMIDPECEAGCAGRRTDAMVETEAPKVGPSCVTPCSLGIPRSQSFVATFSKEGYQAETIRVGLHVTRDGAAGMAGNLLLGGAIGGVTDMATGAAQDHDPNPVKATLKPLARQTEPKTKKR
jgi:hypothetical protein